MLHAHPDVTPTLATDQAAQLASSNRTLQERQAAAIIKRTHTYL